MTVPLSLMNRYSRRRFACLFFSLLITMVAAPVLAAIGLSIRFMEFFLALNILAAVLVTLFSFGGFTEAWDFWRWFLLRGAVMPYRDTDRSLRPAKVLAQ